MALDRGDRRLGQTGQEFPELELESGALGGRPWPIVVSRKLEEVRSRAERPGEGTRKNDAADRRVFADRRQQVLQSSLQLPVERVDWRS